MTPAPSCAKRVAMARPMPFAAPVTMTVLPLKRVVLMNFQAPGVGRKTRSLTPEARACCSTAASPSARFGGTTGTVRQILWVGNTSRHSEISFR